MKVNLKELSKEQLITIIKLLAREFAKCINSRKDLSQHIRADSNILIKFAKADMLKKNQ